MEIATFAAVITTLKNLKDLTASLGDQVPPQVREQVLALSDKLLEMQAAALDAQQREIHLTNRCRQLEDELSRVNDWEAERARYTLVQVSKLASVYVQKLDVDTPHAPHWLCANCFEDRQKSYLQPGEQRSDRRTWKCQRCHATLVIYWDSAPESQTDQTAP